MMPKGTRVSAGILAYRCSPQLAFLLAHPGGPYWRNRDEGAWSIPKGIVVSSDLLACAKREFREETGLTPSGQFTALTPLRQKGGKTVHAFAVEANFDLRGFSSNTFEMEWPPRSGKAHVFPEVDRIDYFDLKTAQRKILSGQRPFIDELVLRLYKKAPP